jgi:hypothetical protein
MMIPVGTISVTPVYVGLDVTRSTFQPLSKLIYGYRVVTLFIVLHASFEVTHPLKLIIS